MAVLVRCTRFKSFGCAYTRDVTQVHDDDELRALIGMLGNDPASFPNYLQEDHAVIQHAQARRNNSRGGGRSARATKQKVPLKQTVKQKKKDKRKMEAEAAEAASVEAAADTLAQPASSVARSTAASSAACKDEEVASRDVRKQYSTALYAANCIRLF